MNADVLLDAVAFDAAGLVPAIAQDHRSGAVLMVAYMNADTLRQTLATGVMTYWSRSRRAVWVKGETSGHTQHVLDVRVDCDGDVLLFQVTQLGDAACHTGHRTCFFRRFDGEAFVEVEPPVVDPGVLYGPDA